MPDRPIVMFYVQHLFGIGHVFRATRIAKALVEARCETHLVWGGTTVPNLDFTGMNLHRLSPVRSLDESFSQLVHADGKEFTRNDEGLRCDQLLSLFETIQPDILITEAYPFGRRQMRFELIPLITAAGNRSVPPLIVSSIRDIMQEGRKPVRVEEALGAVQDHYDLVLVHGDPALARIEDTLQGAGEIQDYFRYSGLVAPDFPSKSSVASERACDVLVSSGGGATGYALLELAMKAMPLCRRFPANWRFVAGTEMPMEKFERLQQLCPQHASLERYIGDMVAAMARSKVSVSRAGYNTVGDVLRAGPTSILIPFTGGRETEQLRRAELMQERGIATMLDETTLTPARLAAAIDNALSPEGRHSGLKLDGATESAKILLEEFSRFRN